MDILCLGGVMDFYKFDTLLTEDEKIFRDSVRRWANTEIYPRVGNVWTRGNYDRNEHEFIKKAAASIGLLGMKEAGASNVMYGLACQEVERVDSGLRSFVSVQNSLVYDLIARCGSEEQKKHYLPKMMTGEWAGCFCLTEPNYGSNPTKMQTRATPVVNAPGSYDDNPELIPEENMLYLLNGSKMWITNGVFADFMIVWARNEFDGALQGFIVDSFETVDRREIPNKMSLRYSDTAEIYFTNTPAVALPNAVGIKHAYIGLNYARYGIAWGAIGAATDMYEKTVQYLKDRSQFDKPLASHQLVQEKLVDILTGIVSAQFMTLQLGRLMDKNEYTPAMISLAKRNNVRMALAAARKCRDLHGAYGICTEYDIIRHMMNLESVFTYEGADHVQTLVVGQDITGIGAFK